MRSVEAVKSAGCKTLIPLDLYLVARICVLFSVPNQVCNFLPFKMPPFDCLEESRHHNGSKAASHCAGQSFDLYHSKNV